MEILKVKYKAWTKLWPALETAKKKKKKQQTNKQQQQQQLKPTLVYAPYCLGLGEEGFPKYHDIRGSF